MICILLFSSLVLNIPSPSRTSEIVILLVPLVAAVGFGVATVGGVGTNPGDGGCFFREPLGAQALTVLIGAALPILINFVLAFVITARLSQRHTRMAAEHLRLKGTGILASNRRATDDVTELSRRLIMYPLLILLCGGTAIVATIFDDVPVLAFIGEIAITISGFANTIAFLVFDPTASKLAVAILEESHSGKGRPRLALATELPDLVSPSRMERSLSPSRSMQSSPRHKYMVLDGPEDPKRGHHSHSRSPSASTVYQSESSASARHFRMHSTSTVPGTPSTSPPSSPPSSVRTLSMGPHASGPSPLSSRSATPDSSRTPMTHDGLGSQGVAPKRIFSDPEFRSSLWADAFSPLLTILARRTGTGDGRM
ncbi:hypothetical protein M427DRAFT_393801 [Gonapodya prolifera JEL478]|uniref:G-protein coupled receptors family 1 profile domain-containing protein n=1 Tax=Gonapodya prolifera (strain JEL478) TaxID=1344416 RepID=A0A139A7H1_GONPJ|nr:hypothetical protein M427DRAFT_393801 [Gonapodya prolifera JEL478]|eukprot:KXS12644.1 hypothetical protein M427DRAFT_393801 [Gonapodya prolifera JEL478]